MAVLVTGGAGYIGSHVVRQLSELKKEVIVLDDLSTGSLKNLVHGEKVYEGNVGDKNLLNKIFAENKIEAVLHFAASIVVPESVKNPIKYYKNNSLNTLTLVETCVENKIKNFIFSSTAAVYGSPIVSPIPENYRGHAISPYGRSKFMSENIIEDVSMAHDFKYVILRYFNVAGADPELRMGQRMQEATHIVKICCQVAAGLRRQVEIYGTDYPTPDGTCRRDYIHVEDLAQAHVLALEHLLQGKESLLLNVGYGESHSVKEVIEIARKVTGVNFNSIEAPRRDGDVPELVAKSELIRQKLNWKPRYNELETIIEHAWAWEKHILATGQKTGVERRL